MRFNFMGIQGENPHGNEVVFILILHNIGK